MRKVFLATAKAGKLDWGSRDNEASLHDTLKWCEGKTWRLEFVEKKRTLSLNARYWAYLNDCEEQTGNLASDLHEMAKRIFLKPKFIKVVIDGKEQEIRIPSSTTDLNSGEFMEYLDKLVAWTGIRMRTREELGYLPK